MTKINDCIECGQPASAAYRPMRVYIECTECARASRDFHACARDKAIKEWNSDNKIKEKINND